MTTEALNGPQGPERRPERSQTPERAPEAATGESSGTRGASEASGPVAELRDAVAKLRKLVHNATPGPWRDHDTHLGRFGYAATVLSGTGNDTELRAWLPSMSQEPWDEDRNVWNDAAYIATMHPAVGGMLAGWLHLVADVIEARIAEDGADRRAVDANGDYALRIARLINGETGEP